jgi:hypothetical protein
MAPNLPRWIGWTLVFAAIATPASVVARWSEQAFGWSHLWQDAAMKLPLFLVASMAASRLFPLQSLRKPQ